MVESAGEATLAFQLKAAKIAFEREFRFGAPRRWRSDFRIGEWLIEVEGGAFSGGHKRGAAADTDTEKQNAAVIDGWRPLRFTTSQVQSGYALQTIEKALGR